MLLISPNLVLKHADSVPWQVVVHSVESPTQVSSQSSSGSSSPSFETP